MARHAAAPPAASPANPLARRRFAAGFSPRLVWTSLTWFGVLGREIGAPRPLRGTCAWTGSAMAALTAV
jgi:hypothetical protein